MTFAPPPVYPPDLPLRELRTPELLLTITFRLFVEAWYAPGDRRGDWCGGLRAAGLKLSDTSAFERLFAILIVTQQRPLQIGCPHCPALSRDEARLLQIVSLFQRGHRDGAVAVLGAWLPPAAQRLAIAPAHALAEALAMRNLLIPWRHAQAADVRTGQPVYRHGLALVQ